MKRTQESGVALLYALLLIALLFVLVLQISFSSKLLVRVTNNSLDDLRVTYALRSGYQYGSLYIASDSENHLDSDNLHEDWSQPLETLQVGESSVEVRIDDEQRRFNIGRLVVGETVNEKLIEQIDRLAEILGIDIEDSIGERIRDYIDKDTEGDFEAGAKNEPLFNLDEIFRIPGIDPTVWSGTAGGEAEATEGLLPYLTIYPPVFGRDQQPQINVNTAPAVVIQALSEEMTEDIAVNIVEHRTGEDENGEPIVYRSPSDLLNVDGMTQEILSTITPFITTRSFFFTIHSTASSGNIRRSAFYVVRRDISEDGEEATTRLVYWQNERDFLRFQDPDRREAESEPE
jgi:type II secretory pathway component PulK